MPPTEPAVLVQTLRDRARGGSHSLRDLNNKLNTICLALAYVLEREQIPLNEEGPFRAITGIGAAPTNVPETLPDKMVATAVAPGSQEQVSFSDMPPKKAGKKPT